jgi:hypothetical protein
MKVYQTNRLFYGKYPYRVETVVVGASRLNFWGVDKTMAFCRNEIHVHIWEKFSPIEKTNLYKFAESIKECRELGIKTRAESETMNIYCLDLATYNIVKEKFKKWVYSITAPANNDVLTKLSSKPLQRLCKQLPHNRYTHKVILRQQMPDYQKLKFAEWLNSYKDSIKPSNGTLKWLNGTNNYLQDPFVYVDNSKQLTLVGMFLGDNLRKVQEFVLQDA